MKGNPLFVTIFFAGMLLASCSKATPALTAALTSPAMLAEEVLTPRPTASPTPTPDLVATGRARREATVQAQQTESSREQAMALAFTPTRTPRPTDKPVSLFGSSVDENIREMSKNWQVAYYQKTTHQICVMKGDGGDKFCLDHNKNNINDVSASWGFLSWYPDGTRLRIVSSSGCGYAWTIGEDNAIIRDGLVCKWGISFSPDGKYIAYLSDELERRPFGRHVYNEDIFIYDLEGTFHKPITAIFAGDGLSLAWSPDGKNLAYTYYRIHLDKSGVYVSDEWGLMYVYSLESGKTFNLTENAYNPAWSPDGRFIAFLSNRDGSFNIYLMNSNGSGVRKVTDYHDWPYDFFYNITWLPDSKHILYRDRLIDLDTGDVEILNFPFDVRYAVWFMPIDDCTTGWTRLTAGRLAKVSEDSSLPNRVRSGPSSADEIIGLLDPGAVVQVIEGPVCADGLVFWKVESASIPGGVGWTAEGDGKEYYLEPYQPQTLVPTQTLPKELAILRGHEGGVLNAQFSPDGKRVVTASLDGTARLWDAATGKTLAVLRGHQGGVWNAQFSPDGWRVVTSGEDGVARLWDAASGKELLVIRGYEGGICCAQFSPDGRLVVTAGEDETARVWESVTGKELVVFRGHEGRVSSVQFSPDGKRVATASSDSTTRVWEVSTGRELTVLRRHERYILSVQFSPDAQRLVIAVGEPYQTVLVWDAATGVELAVLRGHVAAIWSAQFSPDGKRVVTASYDGTARVWDAATGKELVVFRGHKGSIYYGQFSPDGRWVITAGEDGTARLWDAASGEELLILRGHEARVNFVQFSSDGKRVVTASLDGTARMWNVDIDK